MLAARVLMDYSLLIRRDGTANVLAAEGDAGSDSAAVGDGTKKWSDPMSNTDVFALNLCVILIIGLVTYLFSEKTQISIVPVLILLGIAAGPVLNIVDRPIAHQLFNYARVFGLVIILFAEGHNLKWEVLRKHLGLIGVLDTAALLITAALSAVAFSLLFHLPPVVGFLFGAIISATDPATLIPLFKRNHVDEEVRTIIVTESIFNDPLGIVLTAVAIAFVAPHAPSAHFVEAVAQVTTIYPAAVIFFLYEVGISIALGIALGFFGYWIINALHLTSFSEQFSLVLALGGFAIGEVVQGSGFLVATVMGIVLGNHEYFFKRTGKVKSHTVDVVATELHFNEILAEFSTVFIFTLLGASLSLDALGNMNWIWLSLILAGLIIFVIRPIASLTILPYEHISWGKFLFISLEGPRGVVPSALASLPLTLGIQYHNVQLQNWGEVILTATVVTIFASVTLEPLWVGPLNRWLLQPKAHREGSRRRGVSIE